MRASSIPVLVVVPATAWLLHQMPQLPSSVALLACAGAGVLCCLIRLPCRMAIALASATLLLFSWRAEQALDYRLPASLEGVDLPVRGVITHVPRTFAHGVRFRFRVETCTTVIERCPMGRLLSLSWYGRRAQSANLSVGQRWAFRLRLKRPHGVINPAGSDRELNALSRGLAAVGYVRAARKSERGKTFIKQLAHAPPSFALGIESLREAVTLKLAAALARWPVSTRGTLIALVTGQQSAIDSPTWEVYRRTGTAHLMAISGLHVTMLSGLMMLLAGRLLTVRIGLVVAIVKRVPAPHLIWCVGLLSAFAYSAFSGWGIPAQRTSWMLLVAGIAVLTGRARSVAHVLAAAAALVTLMDPWAPLRTGFWLSLAVVAAIVAFGSGYQPRSTARVWQAVRTQWAATIALIPLGAVWFSSVSLIGPLANGVAIPVVAMLVTPLSLLAALLLFVFEPIGQLLFHFVAAICWAILWLLNELSQASGAMWITGAPTFLVIALATLACALLLAPRFYGRRWPGLALLVPVLSLPADSLPNGAWSMLVFDVGQGTSVLIRTRDHHMLYDAGPSYGVDNGAGRRIIAPLLRARQVRKLDVLMISHRDNDHAGGAAYLLRRFEIKRLISSISPTHRLRQQAQLSEQCRRGQSWSWDGVQFDVLHPGGPVHIGARSTSNARSCVLRISSAAGSALLTGDIERAQERLLLSATDAKQLSADVMLAPHHGSKTSSSGAFLDVVSPQWAVFQMAYRNRYGHPAGSVLKRYVDRGITTLRSDRDGAIEFTFERSKEPVVVRYRRDNRRYWRIDGDG